MRFTGTGAGLQMGSGELFAGTLAVGPSASLTVSSRPGLPSSLGTATSGTVTVASGGSLTFAANHIYLYSDFTNGQSWSAVELSSCGVCRSSCALTSLLCVCCFDLWLHARCYSGGHSDSEYE